jgi:twitching motility protein PilT
VQGGLIPAYELLLVTPAVQNLIREKRTHEIDNIIETSSEQGMMSMDRSLSDLVRTGQVPIDVAMKYARNPTLFQRLV